MPQTLQPIVLENDITTVYKAGEKMVELGRLATEMRLEGYTPTEELFIGKRIEVLIEAYRNENLTTRERTHILHCLRRLNGENDLTSVPQPPTYVPPEEISAVSFIGRDQDAESFISQNGEDDIDDFAVKQ